MAFLNEKTPLEVIVIGGSIAGLMHGIVLKRQGHNVRILERSPASLFDDQGAGITALERVEEFFSKHDLLEKPHFVMSAQFQFINKAAKIVRTWKMPLSMTSWNTLYYRLRANFDGLTSDYVPQTEKLVRGGDGRAVYEFGTTVTGVQDDNDVVTVHFDKANGESGSLQADLVIAADGPGSTIRKLLYPSMERKYAGYVGWRGTVPESEMSESAKQVLNGNLTYFIHKGASMLLYTIPGKNGTIERGHRLLNYVWYCNYPQNSQSHISIMTDNAGHHHKFTIPPGKMRHETWSAQQTYAKRILPAPFAELVLKTKHPFLQSITDIDVAQPCHFGNKLLLVGDALCSFRPHAGSSTNQSALNALLLEKVLRGEMTLQGWEQQCVDYARVTSLTSVAYGNKNQFGVWTFLLSVARMLWARMQVVFRTSWRVLPALGI